MHTKGFIAGLLLTAITSGASLSWAADLEIITPPLLTAGYVCMVTNVSDGPVNIRIQVLDILGNFLLGAGASGLPPLWTSYVSSIPATGVRKCRVTSDDGKKGDLKVTFCTLAADGACQAAVTAE